MTSGRSRLVSLAAHLVAIVLLVYGLVILFDMGGNGPCGTVYTPVGSEDWVCNAAHSFQLLVGGGALVVAGGLVGADAWRRRRQRMRIPITT